MRPTALMSALYLPVSSQSNFPKCNPYHVTGWNIVLLNSHLLQDKVQIPQASVRSSLSAEQKRISLAQFHVFIQKNIY